MSTFACVIWCSRPPNSELDITDTRSRYANRKSYITLNCRRAFQIWRIRDIDKKESFTNVEIIPLSVLRYFMLRPLVFVIRSFLLVSVSLFRLNSSRRGTVTFVLVFVWCYMIDIGSLLMPISRPGLFLDWPLLFISFLQPISGDFVSKSIRVLKTIKAVGLDTISALALIKFSGRYYSFFNKFTDNCELQ